MVKITPQTPPTSGSGSVNPPPIKAILPDYAQPANVEGDSDSGVGVRGMSNSGIGVVGSSSTDDGVQGRSQKGAGVHGVGSPAGKFDGNVVVSGDLNAGSTYVNGQAQVKGPMNIGGGLSVGGDISANGNVNVTGDVIFTGGDCAEEIEASSADIEPGSVVVVNNAGSLSSCSEAYDKRVVGIVSGAGTLKPAIILGRNPGAEKGGKKALLALSGRVFCKVDAGFAPIEVGDLLTTSSTLGHAMRADPQRSVGRVIGKAMGSLQMGRGLIPVLVSLQ